MPYQYMSFLQKPDTEGFVEGEGPALPRVYSRGGLLSNDRDGRAPGVRT